MTKQHASTTKTLNTWEGLFLAKFSRCIQFQTYRLKEQHSLHKKAVMHRPIYAQNSLARLKVKNIEYHTLGYTRFAETMSFFDRSHKKTKQGEQKAK